MVTEAPVALTAGGNLPRFLTVAQFSDLVQVSDNHTYECIKRGEIPARYVLHFGRNIRIDAAYLADRDERSEASA